MQTRTFKQELKELLDRHRVEGMGDTPHWILAEYLMGCLQTFEKCDRIRSNQQKDGRAVETPYETRVYVPGLGHIPKDVLTPDQARDAEDWKAYKAEVIAANLLDDHPRRMEILRTGIWPADELGGSAGSRETPPLRPAVPEVPWMTSPRAYKYVEKNWRPETLADVLKEEQEG